ncbi:MAG: hypothetical protein GMKNLPBB_00587 [Myxococcota bacterium]|nr:hypothetical protein [Myxococcota bacterium]
MFRVAIAGAIRKARKIKVPPPAVPGPEIRFEAPAPTREHAAAFVKTVFGDASRYRDGTIPPPMFCIHGMKVIAKSLDETPWDLTSALHVGAGLRINRHLNLRDGPLRISGRLIEASEDERRIILKQRMVFGNASNPEGWEAICTEWAPKKVKGGERKKDMKAPDLIPPDAREAARWKLAPDMGVRYAMVGGDFNPVHVSNGAAKAMGFKRSFLQGFGILAMVYEGLVSTVCVGDRERLKWMDIRFLKPLFLPSSARLFIRDGEFFIGPAPGGEIRAQGEFTLGD